MIDDMPMTPVGKIFKPRLREIAARRRAAKRSRRRLPGAPFEVAARHGETGLVLTAKVSADAVEIARAELGKFSVRFEVLAL